MRNGRQRPPMAMRSWSAAVAALPTGEAGRLQWRDGWRRRPLDDLLLLLSLKLFDLLGRRRNHARVPTHVDARDLRAMAIQDERKDARRAADARHAQLPRDGQRPAARPHDFDGERAVCVAR